jgi:hypothetical protein
VGLKELRNLRYMKLEIPIIVKSKGQLFELNELAKMISRVHSRKMWKHQW